MNICPGTILISAPFLDDANFEKAVIFIVEHNEKGTLGFVINKLFPRQLNELVEFKHSKPIDLFDGGPVEKEGLFFQHRRVDVIEGGTAIVDSIYMGGDFKQTVALINNGNFSANDIKLFIGYCGWNDNELQEEIAEGSWLVTTAAAEIAFATTVETLWEELYKGRG